jgi:hypothetical protein
VIADAMSRIPQEPRLTESRGPGTGGPGRSRVPEAYTYDPKGTVKRAGTSLAPTARIAKGPHGGRAARYSSVRIETAVFTEAL